MTLYRFVARVGVCIEKRRRRAKRWRKSEREKREKNKTKKKRTAASCLPGRTEGSWWRCSLQHGPKILGMVVSVVVVVVVVVFVVCGRQRARV